MCPWRAQELKTSLLRVRNVAGVETPVANIARVTAILERSHDPDMHQALLYT
jgi:hypothetical protein